MMSSKRTSQLAMLSILLTFSHSVSYASAAVSPFEVSSSYVDESLIALESRPNKKELRLQKIQEHRLAQQKEKEAGKDKEVNRSSLLLVSKLNQEKRDRRQERQKQSLSFLEKRRLREEKRKKEQVSLNQQIHEGIGVCESFVQNRALALLTRGGQYSRRCKKARGCEQNAVVSNQMKKRTGMLIGTPSNETPGWFLKTTIVKEGDQPAFDNLVVNDSAISTSDLSAREKTEMHEQAGARVRESSSKTPRSFLKTMVVNREAKILSESKEENQVVREFKDGPVLPIFVRPDAEAVALKERDKLIQDLAREQRIAKRKSSREALEARVKENKIARGGKITSTLRYDVEKAAAVKVKRNSSVNPQVRAQKASNTRRSARNEQNAQEPSQNVKSDSSDKQNQVANNLVTDDYYGVAASAGNTNVKSYLSAKQYRCDSSETDWPCSSCVAKRRTHTSISVCTTVVTVIAMIVGAIIIANASDSTSSTGGTTPPPKPTP
ncbi:conserved hypothetical protein [Chlamydia felis Fe/C-56]|uniref:Uncharacterized protein n=1 Tax=Chlamydia felis (strain Fe/C-56) TaxID=264202 RepID=Q253W0_CHLFF|nr:hypothetical protein [Chlamydia felis]BAE81428.1 conserved hypothetical protein [Chlamydia felis Fe/C-56]